MPQTKNEPYTVTLLSDLEIQGTRMLDAPRELVFDVHTKPEHLVHWWGGMDPLVVCEVDLRPGGAWRFVERSAEGEEWAFHGEFLDIVRPEKLVYTFEFEGMPGHVCTETLTFEERDGGTLLTDHTLFASKEDRDGMIEAGMEEGANISLSRLDAYLETLR